MLTPSNRTITIASGGTALVGRTTAIMAPSPPLPSGKPAWLAALNPAIGQWVEVPNTTVGVKQVSASYSGMAVTPAGQIVVAASGGHTDGNLSFVYSINMGMDAPAWSFLKPFNSNPDFWNFDQPYDPAGNPSARHSYWTPVYVPGINALVMTGCYAPASSGNSAFPTIDAFYLSTNTWSAPGSMGYATPADKPYPGPNGSGVYPATGSVTFTYGMLSSSMVDSDGYIWSGAEYKYDHVNHTWSAAATTTLPSSLIPRAPWAHDSVRNESFAICYGDGQGYSLGLGVVAVRRKNGVVQTVTINDSAAKAAFAAEIPGYAAMTYNPVTGKYYYHYGNGVAGRVYIITPNNSLAWDMEIMSTTGGINSGGSGIDNRFQYVQSLGGILAIPQSDPNVGARGVFFLRTE